MGKKSLSIFLACILLVISIPVSAQKRNNDLAEDISTLTALLQEILSDNFIQVKNSIKEEIVEKNYDYALTMETVEEIHNPYKNMDYIDVLASYMTVKDYCKEHHIDSFKGISEIQFLSYEIEEIETSIPNEKKYETYVETEKEGVYIQKGYEYATEEIEVDKFIENEDGTFRKEGTRIIRPEDKKVKYGDVKFSVVTADEIFSLCGLNKEKLVGQFEKYKAKLNNTTNNDGINQSLFVMTPTGIDNTELELRYVSQNRASIVKTAQSLIGQVPYEWGGKSNKAGYDTSWWTFDTSGTQKGLDCSGFVQWAYRTALQPQELWQKLLSTGTILKSGFKEINREDLQPGDIGVLHRGDIGINHTGIYAGNINGKDLWIHCSGSADTVVISEFNFKIFLNPFGDTKQTIKEDNPEKEDNFFVDKLIERVYYTDKINQDFDNSDVYTLAQLITHEAGGEGMNGWIAVAEVVKNRVNSSHFPNTINDVIYQKNQFSSVSEISSITPRQEIINVAQAVLNGQISIINNAEVLYFKNPTTTDGIPATEIVDWGEHKYYTAIGHHAFYLQ